MKEENTKVTESAENAEAEKAVDVAGIEAMVEDILAKAQAKADEIIKRAEKAATKIKAPGETGEENPELQAHLDELVTVRLFKDKNKYKDDVYVAVNGENCLIQRGKDVQIKRKFALVLEQSLDQDEFAASYFEGLQNEYAEKEKAGHL